MMNIVRTNSMNQVKDMINAMAKREQEQKAMNTIVKNKQPQETIPMEQPVELEGYKITRVVYKYTNDRLRITKTEYDKVITGEMIANAMMDLRDPADDQIDM